MPKPIRVAHVSHFFNFPGGPNAGRFVRVDCYQGERFGRGDDYVRARAQMLHHFRQEPFYHHTGRDAAGVAREGLKLLYHFREIADGEFDEL